MEVYRSWEIIYVLTVIIWWTKFSLSWPCYILFSSRQTGALNRIIDRGSRAINFILSSMVFNVVPTVLEVWTVYCCSLGQISQRSLLLTPFFSFLKKSSFLKYIIIFIFSFLYLFFARLLWCQVFLHTSLDLLLHGSHLFLLQHMLLSLWLSHRYNA